MFPLEPLLLPPSRFETRALQQGPSTQISLTLHCFLVWTSPASLSEAHMHISLHLPGRSFSSGTHSWTQEWDFHSPPHASFSQKVNTHSSGCDSSVMFLPTFTYIKIISHRGHAAFGLHVVSIFHLAFFFKVQCINEFPQSVSRRSLFSFFLRALHFTRHGLQCIWLILALCNIPMAISTVLASRRPPWLKTARWSSKKSPNLSLLHVGLCSQQQTRAADTGGGGVRKQWRSRWNNCSRFWTLGSPVWPAVPKSCHLV